MVEYNTESVNLLSLEYKLQIVRPAGHRSSAYPNTKIFIVESSHNVFFPFSNQSTTKFDLLHAEHPTISTLLVC